MAATVSVWGKPGAWAMDAEENETELLRQRKEDDDKAISNTTNGGELADFPSLSAAAATKTKKKKPHKISLQDLNNYGSAKPAEPEGLTPDELLMLPTGPRQRTADELDRNKLGGGFKSYGGGISREERRPRSFSRESSEFTPSRADETDNWAAAKKPTMGFGGSERRERGGFFPDSASRADDVDNWAAKKSFLPSEPRRYEKRGSFGLGSAGSNGSSDSDNWSRGKEDEGRRSGAFDSLRERKGGFESNGGGNGADGETWGRKREEVNGGFGGRPRLNLQPRTLPLSEDDKKGEVKSSKGNNPFGQARPREEVLKEKGQDWKEIEDKLESMKVKDCVISDVGNKRDGFWGGKERKNGEAKAERAWRKPLAVADDSPLEQRCVVLSSPENELSASELENGLSQIAEDGEGAEVELKYDDVHI